jgi:site-specific recombinase XerD
MTMWSPPFGYLTSVKGVFIDEKTLVHAADSWIMECHVRLLSDRTADNRRRVIDKLIWFIRENNIDGVNTLVIKQFLAYISTAHKTEQGRWGHKLSSRNGTEMKPVSSETSLTYFRVLRTFFKWMETEEMIIAAPTAAVKPPISRPDQINPFSESDIRAILSSATKSNNPNRDRAIILILLDTGIRASELANMKFEDLDIIARTTYVTGKGNIRRMVAFGSATARAMWTYLKMKERAKEDPVFISDRGGFLSKDSLYTLIKRICDRAGVTRDKCGPHTFRHTFAVEFLRQGGNIFTLQQMLGHSTLSMTNHYVLLAQADIKMQARKFSPANKYAAK